MAFNSENGSVTQKSEGRTSVRCYDRKIKKYITLEIHNGMSLLYSEFMMLEPSVLSTGMLCLVLDSHKAVGICPCLYQYCYIMKVYFDKTLLCSLGVRLF